MKLKELAKRLGCELEGSGEVEIKGIASLEEAGEGDLSFAAHPRYLPYLGASKASAFILSPDVPPCGKPTLRTPNPYLAFAKALLLFFPPFKPTPGIHPTAVIAEGVPLGEGVSVGPFSVLEEGVSIGEGTAIGPLVYIGRGSRIGRGCLIYPLVTVREGVLLGDRVIVHSGTVIGSDGFGYAKDAEGRYVKIPQVGGVSIEDDVEIGANVAIDRATLGRTWIKRGTKIDNLVQIAHNVVVGEDSAIVAQAGIAGSTVLGNRVSLAGQVGVVGHITVGDDVTVGAQSGVTKSIPPGSTVLGSPAVPHMEFKRALVGITQIPRLFKALHDLEERIQKLEERLAAGGGR